MAVFSLTLARCAGFVFRAPGFSHPSVPVMARAGLALALAVSLASGTRVHPSNQVQYLVALLVEIAIGAAIGFAASLLYEAASSAGKVLDAYVGVQISNPTAQVATGEGFGALWSTAFLAAYFFFGGYEFAIAGLADSVTRLPIGAAIEPHALYSFAFNAASTIMRAAALVAAPAIVLGMVAQIGLGAIARVIPRFSNITLTFPVVFGAVLLATIATLPFLMRTGERPWPVAPFFSH